MKNGHLVGLVSVSIAALVSVVPCSAAQFPRANDRDGAASLPKSTGELGDPDRLMFYGNETFAGDQIVGGLVMNPDFLLSSHPVAPFAEYLEVIKAKVKAGYRCGGFADADVLVRYDEFTGKILVRIKEGPRYISADISVEGVPEQVKEAIIKGLTKETAKVSSNAGAPRQTPTDKLLWIHGKPADFSQLHLTAWKYKIRSLLSEEGYFFPWVDVEIVAEEDKKTARLVAKVQDLGPQGVVDEITVEGNTKNTREEILDYLGLKSGMHFNSKVVARTERLLRDSARFLHYKISPHPEFSKEAKLKLHIEVKEYDNAPPLGAELSILQKSLLQLGDYILGWQEGEEDLIVTYETGTKDNEETKSDQIIVSPTNGILYLAWKGEGGAAKSLAGAVYIGADEVAIYSVKNKRKLVFTRFAGRLVISLAVEYSPDANPERPNSVSFAAGYDSEKSALAVDFDIKINPVTLMHQAHWLESGVDEHSYTHDDGILHCRSEIGEMKIDSKTCRLIEARFKFKDASVRLNTRAGAFESAFAKVKELGAPYPNVFDSKKPISSAVSFFAMNYERSVQKSSGCGSPDQCDSRIALSDILVKIVPPSLDAYFAEHESSEESEFRVPIDLGSGSQEMLTNLGATLSAAVFKLTDDLFARGSWPWTLSRETVFILGGMGKYSLVELGRIYESEETGPLGYLTAAKVLSRLSPRLGGTFAAKGLSKMSVEEFRKDVRVLLEGDSKLARCLIETAEALRDLDDAERDALLLVFDAEQAEVIGRSIDILRKDKSIPVKEVIPGACDELWREFLQKRVEAALRKLATQYSVMNNPN